MENYRQIKVLGKGSFGAAWLVQRIKDNAQFVAKEVRLSGMKPQEKESAKHEIAMLRQLDHPNITRYIDHFEHKGSLFIVMEYANGGDLYTKIQGRRGVRFTEKEILHYFSQICLALMHLHEKRILHRDLKSQNVFLTADGIVKLGDFGISTVLRNTYELKRTVCGTPYYFSPELCLNKPYNNKSDVWALGCILYELTTLNHAFDGNSMKALVQKILKGVYPPIHPSYSSDLSKLVSSTLKIDPVQRPNIQQVLQLPFVRTFLSGLQVDMQGAKEEKKPLVDPEEKVKMQRDAQVRMEAEKAAQAQRDAQAKQQAEAKERDRLRAEARRQELDRAAKEHDEKLRVIREQQKVHEQEQRKKDLEQRVKEQRKLQEERSAQLARIQKQREEEWEKNLKQQQEEFRRKGEQMEARESPPPARSPVVAVHDPTEAARLYREMRREAMANRQRALDNVGASPTPGRFEPIIAVAGRPTPQPQPQPSAAQPVNRPQAPQSDVDIEEARRAAFWQMRREAEENRRRVLGLEPIPQHASPAGRPPSGLSPPLRPVEVRKVSPPPAAAEPSGVPKPLLVAPVPETSDDDEEVGLHNFLNGEAILQQPPADQRQELANVQNAIQTVLAGGNRLEDFADPDENDPSRFILDGQTLHLPNCNSGDPLMSRIESLRLFLEASIGEDAFLQAYRLMDNIQEEDEGGDDVVQKIQAILPPHAHRYIPVISQLLVCEGFFNRQ